jgi:hypothetical protein
MDLIADHISHRFGALDVLDDVSFTVRAGEVSRSSVRPAAARAHYCRYWGVCCSRARA